MITPTTLLQRIVAKVSRPHFTIATVWLPSEQDEWNEMQLDIATETAMSTAVDIIKWQTAAWNEAVQAAEAYGIFITISPEASKELDEMVARLKAAMTVAQEVSQVDLDTLKGFH